MVLKEGVPFILSLSDRLKLWADTLKQLEQEAEGLLTFTDVLTSFIFQWKELKVTSSSLTFLLIEVKESGNVTLKRQLALIFLCIEERPIALST